MPKESKLIQINKQDYEYRKVIIYENESFGWELLTIDGYEIAMTRDYDNPKLSEIKQYENTYNTLNSEYITLLRSKKQLNLIYLIILFAIFIIPAITYVIFIKGVNKEINNRANTIRLKMKEVSMKSRIFFFNLSNDIINENAIEKIETK